MHVMQHPQLAQTQHSWSPEPVKAGPVSTGKQAVIELILKNEELQNTPDHGFQAIY
jgi:hypothetical protein